MKHGSLFSGIGGFDLAAEWMGWENVFHCEWNEFGQRILKYYWPKAKSYNDITKTDFTPHRGTIDILSGGFPCQPYSQAGKRLGTEDERHLWPEMLRAIREIQPRYVVGENVSGLVNWSGGLVFEEVQTNLENEGYEVQAFILPACAVNAPHRRDRVWFVAHANGSTTGPPRTSGKTESNGGKNNDEPKSGRKQTEQHIGCSDVPGNIANPNGTRFQKTGTEQQTAGIKQYGELDGNATNANSEQRCEGRLHAPEPEKAERHLSSRNARSHKRGNWQDFPTQPPIRQRNDGFSRPLVRYITKELRDEISKTSEENRIKNLPEVWQKISKEEIWQKVRGLYSLETKEVLLQTMQLYSARGGEQGELSPFSEKFSEPILRKLRKYGEFGSSPQGQELGKQRTQKYPNSLSFLPHEVALAARGFETQLAKFEAWHRKESIKAGGNAIVPQVAFEIFKVIQEIHLQLSH